MPSVDVGGLEIAYERSGKGPPLILLHGAASDGREWRPQLEGLADELDVLAWDEPGAGRSSDPPRDFGLADYADCVAQFMDGLGLASAHIGGLSWGGVLAQELYRRHSERVGSLILIDTYAGWKGSLPEAECEQRLAACLEQASVRANEFAPMLPGLFAPGAPASLVAELDAIMVDTRPDSLRRTAVAMAACDHRDLLPQIDVPTLLVWGEADARSSVGVAAQFRDAIPGARLVLIPNAGHMSNMEQPALFNAAVREFCRAAARR
jgi:pimeloyl-ACP methyl ester carboxylesterase